MNMVECDDIRMNLFFTYKICRFEYVVHYHIDVHRGKLRAILTETRLHTV